MEASIIFLGTAGDTYVVGRQLRASGGVIIKVDENQQTNLKSVYAAGDVTGGTFQVIFAAAEGARAALNAVKYLRSIKKE